MPPMRTVKRAHLLHTGPLSHGGLALSSAHQISHTLSPWQDWGLRWTPEQGGEGGYSVRV